jgi:hypothetical protein
MLDPETAGVRRSRGQSPQPQRQGSVTNGTEGVTVSGADALLVIGLVALVLAFGAK